MLLVIQLDHKKQWVFNEYLSKLNDYYNAVMCVFVCGALVRVPLFQVLIIVIFNLFNFIVVFFTV